jgi:hypothetical protein
MARDIQFTYAVAGDDSLTFSVVPNTYAAGRIAEGGVIRAEFETLTDYEEYIVTGVTPASGVNANMIRVSAQAAIPYKLTHLGLIRTFTATGLPGYSGSHVFKSPATILAVITDFLDDEHGITWLDFGTVTPTLSTDYEYANVTALAYLLGYIRKPEIGCEWRWRRNGDVGYLIDIEPQINIGAAVPKVATAYNLRSHLAPTDVSRQANVVRPRGATVDGVRGGIEEATATITDITSLTITFEEDCVPFDGALDGQFLVNDAATFGSTAIDSSEAPNKVTLLSSVAGFAVDDVVMFRETSGESGREITSLQAPDSVALHGIIEKEYRLSSQPTHRNWVKNADMALWSAGDTSDPDEWTTFSGSGTGTLVKSKNTDPDFVVNGPFSLKLALTNPSHFLRDVGARTEAFIHRREGKSTFTVVASIAIGGVALSSVTHVRLELQGAGGVGLTGGQVNVADTALGTPVGKHVLVLPGFDAAVAGRNDYRVRILVRGDDSNAALGGNTQFYIDSLMAVFGEVDLPFTATSFANALREGAIQQLQIAHNPVVQHEVSLLDLGAERAADVITVGGNLRIKNTVLGTDDTVRVMLYRRDPYDPAKSTVTLASRALTMTKQLAAA